MKSRLIMNVIRKHAAQQYQSHPVVIDPFDDVVQKAVIELGSALKDVDVVKLEPSCPNDRLAWVTNEDLFKGKPGKQRVIHLCLKKIKDKFSKSQGNPFTITDPSEIKKMKDVVKQFLKDVVIPHEAEHIQQEMEHGGEFGHSSEPKAEQKENWKALEQMGVKKKASENIEIERKFLVKPSFPKSGVKEEVKQGYINTSGDNKVLVEDNELIFIKGGKEIYRINIENHGKELLSKITNDGGSLKTDTKNVVRIRTKAGKGYVTIKGPSKELAIPEFEYPMMEATANKLLNSMTEGYLHKIRHKIKHEGHLWEVDEFKNPPGIVIAEIELKDENEAFEKPEWIKEEVTGQSPYYNSEIIKRIGKVARVIPFEAEE